MGNQKHLRCTKCQSIVTHYDKLSQFQRDGLNKLHDQLTNNQLCKQCIYEFKRTRSTL